MGLPLIGTEALRLDSVSPSNPSIRNKPRNSINGEIHSSESETRRPYADRDQRYCAHPTEGESTVCVGLRRL